MAPTGPHKIDLSPRYFDRLFGKDYKPGEGKPNTIVALQHALDCVIALEAAKNGANRAITITATGAQSAAVIAKFVRRIATHKRNVSPNVIAAAIDTAQNNYITAWNSDPARQNGEALSIQDGRLILNGGNEEERPSTLRDQRVALGQLTEAIKTSLREPQVEVTDLLVFDTRSIGLDTRTFRSKIRNIAGLPPEEIAPVTIKKAVSRPIKQAHIFIPAIIVEEIKSGWQKSTKAGTEWGDYLSALSRKTNLAFKVEEIPDNRASVLQAEAELSSRIETLQQQIKQLQAELPSSTDATKTRRRISALERKKTTTTSDLASASLTKGDTVLLREGETAAAHSTRTLPVITISLPEGISPDIGRDALFTNTVQALAKMTKDRATLHSRFAAASARYTVKIKEFETSYGDDLAAYNKSVVNIPQEKIAEHYAMNHPDSHRPKQPSLAAINAKELLANYHSATQNHGTPTSKPHPGTPDQAAAAEINRTKKLSAIERDAERKFAESISIPLSETVIERIRGNSPDAPASNTEDALAKIMKANDHLRLVTRLTGVKVTTAIRNMPDAKGAGTHKEHFILIAKNPDAEKTTQAFTLVTQLATLASTMTTPISEADIRTALEHMQKPAAPSADVTPMAQAAEEVTAGTRYYYPTGIKLNAEEQSRLRGDNAYAVFKHIEKSFSISLSFDQEGRVRIPESQLNSNHHDRGASKQPILALVFASLESIVTKDKLARPTDKHVSEAIANAYIAQKSVTGHEYTGSGKLITVETLHDIPDLGENPAFASVVQRTIPDDQSYEPSQTLVGRANNNKVLGLITGDSGALLRIISSKFSVGVSVDKAGVRINSRNISAISQARDSLLRLAEALAKQNYTKLEDRIAVAKFAIGEIGSEFLPSANVTRRTGAKLQFNLNTLTPIGPRQENLVASLRNPAFAATMAIGPAGSGKTRLGLQEALRLIQDTDTPFERLIITTSTRTLEGAIPAALPGKLREKIGPSFDRILSPLSKILGKPTENGIDEDAGHAALAQLLDSGKVRMEPLEFILGKSFANAIIVGEEMQAVTVEEMKALITRGEETARIFLSGDLRQAHTARNKLRGEEIVPFNTVHIGQFGHTNSLGKPGYISVFNQGQYITLSHHSDVFDTLEIGHDGAIVKGRPANGLAFASVVFSMVPIVSMTSLTEEDVHRSTGTRAFTAFMEAVRPADVGGHTQNGRGITDPQPILTRLGLAGSAPNVRRLATPK